MDPPIPGALPQVGEARPPACLSWKLDVLRVHGRESQAQTPEAFQSWMCMCVLTFTPTNPPAADGSSPFSIYK